MLRLILLILCLQVMPVQADELSDAVDEVMAKARKQAEQMSIPVNEHQAEGYKVAQETAKAYHSKEFQDKLTCESKRIRDEVFAEVAGEGEGGRQEVVPGKLTKEEKVYLFISSSMPDETIRNYLNSVTRADDPNLVVLMRGFVPGERGKYLVRITKKDSSCKDQLQTGEMCERYEVPITLRPSLFEQYEIDQVPAVVYEAGEQAWKISGDVSLGFMLERINWETARPALDKLSQLLR